MKMWAVYQITHHGEPIQPVFLSKTKMRAEWYLEYQAERWDWDYPDGYYITVIDIPVPKLGIKKTRKKRVIIENGLEIKTQY